MHLKSKRRARAIHYVIYLGVGTPYSILCMLVRSRLAYHINRFLEAMVGCVAFLT